MDRDEYYMKRALSLAKRGLGRTRPNPMVGAVVVKEGIVLSEGYHKKAGLAHAEAEALNGAGRNARGSTLYVNLEPCSHFGKTPPCTDRIIKGGVKRVVAGMPDPNPINSGKGLKRLREAGIEVRCGVLGREARALNRVFTTYITKERPYVTVKVAQSLDGKIATHSGDARWITNEASRRFVHELRGRVDAVLVGVNTIIKDDPLLTCRTGGLKKQPLRVILDSRLRTPGGSRILKERYSKVIIATTKTADKRRVRELERECVEVVPLSRSGTVGLGPLLKYLSRIGISHLLVEGGGTVIASFLKDRLVDEIFLFIAPRIIGGRDAVTSVEGKGIGLVKRSIKLNGISVRRFKEDILVHGYVYRDS